MASSIVLVGLGSLIGGVVKTFSGGVTDNKDSIFGPEHFTCFRITVDDVTKNIMLMGEYHDMKEDITVYKNNTFYQYFVNKFNFVF